METALHDIEMGAYMMVVGKSDILKIIREGGDTLHSIADAVPGKKLIFEAGPGDWPETNMETWDPIKSSRSRRCGMA